MSETDHESRMQWWREARFGMFIHWGLYSQLGGAWKGRQEKRAPSEWIMAAKQIPHRQYKKIARDFNPVEFDARAWAALARGAGMKYMVITSKHHDGFSMFRSALSDYNIADATPFGRDPVAELAAACGDSGVRFGLYYSQLDWRWSILPSPLGLIPNYRKYYKFLKGQLEELLTRYGPVAVLFFDGDWMPQWTKRNGRDVERLCRSLQPEIIINDRVGKRLILDSFVAGKPLVAHFPFLQKMSAGHLGDYVTPEQYVPERPPGGDWETCMTMNTSWGYKSFDHEWKSVNELIATLATVVSNGGNLLLNVGPDEKGNIPEPSVVRLREIGKWLEINGECIYGTTPWRVSSEGPGIRYTAKDGAVYAIILDPPGSNTITLKSPRPADGTKITVLGVKKKIQWKRENSAFVAELPKDNNENAGGRLPVVIKLNGVE